MTHKGNRIFRRGSFSRSLGHISTISCLRFRVISRKGVRRSQDSTQKVTMGSILHLKVMRTVTISVNVGIVRSRQELQGVKHVISQRDQVRGITRHARRSFLRNRRSMGSYTRQTTREYNAIYHGTMGNVLVRGINRQVMNFKSVIQMPALHVISEINPIRIFRGLSHTLS